MFAGHANVMDGIHAAVEQGFDKVKINCVVMRGLNEEEITVFVDLARQLVSLSCFSSTNTSIIVLH